MPYTTLISAGQLEDYLDVEDWIIVDCRFDLGDAHWGRKQYQEAHIPGARYAHLDEDLSGEIIPGETGRHPLPEVESFARLLGSWGINQQTQVVAYDQGGGMFAARLWWMLRWLGHDKVTVLDGGWQRWCQLDSPVTQAEPVIESSTFEPEVRTQMLVGMEAVEALAKEPGHKLLDARAADRFRGENETLDPIAGHIPGAVCAPFMENLGLDGCFLDREKLAQRYQALLGETSAEDAVLYCGSGVTAAHNILAMKHAGLGEPRLYAGSWSHWITDSRCPIATGEE